MKKVGIIVNPIAGMGGAVALKGTDGEDILQRALDLGAIKKSPDKMIRALKELLPIKDSIEILTCPADMGEDEVKELGFNYNLVVSIYNNTTSSAHTILAARRMVDDGADIIIFAGGDGTARDMYTAIGNKCTVIGVPAGVKIHSPVYAINPTMAGKMALKYLKGNMKSITEAEVMDIDEDAFRKNQVRTKLYGYLSIPSEEHFFQNKKAPTPFKENISKEAIAQYVIDQMENDIVYIIGPGSTTEGIITNMNLDNTLLGVDIVQNKILLKKDATEEEILDIVRTHKCKVIITPIGGQGYLFGRGNHQLSDKVIKVVGKDNIMVVSTESKIRALKFKPFYVDTGNEAVDNMLSGYVRVIIGYGDEMIYKVQ